MLKLVKYAQKGDDQAFLKLFQEYEQDLYRMAFLYVKNESDALDVVQEAAYLSFKSIKNLREPKYFKTWLIRIAINCSLDLLRKREKIVQLKAEDKENLLKSEDEDIELGVTLQDLMEILDEKEKSVVLLRFYEGLTFKEVSNTLNIPLGTSKTILYRALEKLRSGVKEADLYE